MPNIDLDKLTILYGFADGEQEWNCSQWRCHALSNAINLRNQENPTGFKHTARMLSLPSILDFRNPMVKDALGMADIIIYQRNILDPVVYASMQYWAALGKVILVDLDDHYANLPASNPAFHFWKKNIHNLDPLPIERLKEGMKFAHGLIAPSKVILADWAKIVPGYYWPNHPTKLNYEKLQPKQLGAPDIICDYDMTDEENPEFRVRPREGTEGKVVIGWGGSISHVDSFIDSGVIDALKQLMEENENVMFKFCGFEGRLDSWFNEFPQKQVIRHGGVRPEHWPIVVSTFDIGIAPLEMTPVPGLLGNEHGEFSYDERRSALKMVEYLCAGVPFVATNAEPYREYGHYGKLVENTPEAWYKALKARVESLPHFKRDAQKRKGWALRRLTMEENTDRLIKFYQGIIIDVQARRGSRLPEVLYIN